jgi:hypothetical protein
MRQNYEPPIQDKDYDEEMGKRVLERAKQVVAAESKSQRRRKKPKPRSLLMAMLLALVVVLLTPAGIFAWQTIYPAFYPTDGAFQSHYVLELPGAELLSRYTSEGQLDETYAYNGLSIAISENHNQFDDSAAMADSTPADYVMEVDGGIKARCYLDDDGAYAYLYSTRCLYMVIVPDGTQEDLNLVLSHLRRT